MRVAICFLVIRGKKSGIDSFYSKFRQGKEITHSGRCFESVPEFTCLSNCSE